MEATEDNNKKPGFMTYPSIPSAKISPPQPAHTLPRRHLFKKLDRSRGKCLTWVAGPPGSGKTALVGGYLASRRKQLAIWYRVDEGDGDPASFFHHLGLAVARATDPAAAPLPRLNPSFNRSLKFFSQRFFEAVGSRLPGPFTLVFDNLHEAGPDTPLMEILQAGVESLPEHGLTILISRHNPAPAFSRLRLQDELVVMNTHDLQFSKTEARDLARFKGLPQPDEDCLDAILERTRGWAAGTLLLLEQSHAGTEAFQGGHLTSNRFCPIISPPNWPPPPKPRYATFSSAQPFCPRSPQRWLTG